METIIVTVTCFPGSQPALWRSGITWTNIAEVLTTASMTMTKTNTKTNTLYANTLEIVSFCVTPVKVKKT